VVDKVYFVLWYRDWFIVIQDFGISIQGGVPGVSSWPSFSLRPLYNLFNQLTGSAGSCVLQFRLRSLLYFHEMSVGLGEPQKVFVFTPFVWVHLLRLEPEKVC
jgi:hypothetical protein